jgi:hypothetical protein
MFMMGNLVRYFVSLSLMCVALVSKAAVIDIQQYSAFIHSDTLGASSLEYTELGYFHDEMTGAGLSVSFTNNLDGENLGSVSWTVTNNTGQALQNASFFVFLDAEIDQMLNYFTNEFGGVSAVSGTGSSDNLADSWEIDEPGYLFGDIYFNLLDGTLDNTNAVPGGLEDDVSLALGFELGDLIAGATMTGVFDISRQDIGGLFHTDADSSETIYFNGTVDVTATPVPEPSIMLLLLTALPFLGLLQRKPI